MAKVEGAGNSQLQARVKPKRTDSDDNTVSTAMMIYLA